MVAFNDKQRMIGDDAVAQYTSNQANSIINAKRFLAMRADNPQREFEEKFNSFKTVEVDGKVCMEVKYDGKTEQFAPEQVRRTLWHRT